MPSQDGNRALPQEREPEPQREPAHHEASAESNAPAGFVQVETRTAHDDAKND
jgi:hypothetical protein